jgi:hypothetical protein
MSSIKGNNPSFLAASSVSAGLSVKITGISGGLTQVAQSDDGTTATGDANIGTALESVSAGELVAVQVDGLVEFAIAGGVIPPGSRVTCNASGEYVAAASGDRSVGILIGGKSSTGATAAGAQCTILLNGPLDVA